MDVAENAGTSRTHVDIEVTYGHTEMRVDLSASPTFVSKARARVSELSATEAGSNASTRSDVWNDRDAKEGTDKA